MSTKVNLAIQILPLGIPKSQAYAIIDEAIDCVKKSGLAHVVCPFETVVEGTYEEVMILFNEMQKVCQQAGAEELLINLKLQRNFNKDIAILDKTGKYQN